MTEPERRRYFIFIAGAVYAYGPTSKGYPNTPEGAEQARLDAAEAWETTPDRIEVWTADPREYGYGHE